MTFRQLWYYLGNFDLLGLNIFGRKKKGIPPRRSGLGMGMQYMCAKFQALSLETAGTCRLFAENMCILPSCLWLLGFSVRSTFCVMFYLILNIGREVRSSNVCVKHFTDMPWSTCCRLVEKKWNNRFFPYENAWSFWAFWMACGRCENFRVYALKRRGHLDVVRKTCVFCL